VPLKREDKYFDPENLGKMLGARRTPAQVLEEETQVLPSTRVLRPRIKPAPDVAPVAPPGSLTQNAPPDVPDVPPDAPPDAPNVPADGEDEEEEALPGLKVGMIVAMLPAEGQPDDHYYVWLMKVLSINNEEGTFRGRWFRERAGKTPEENVYTLITGRGGTDKQAIASICGFPIELDDKGQLGPDAFELIKRARLEAPDTLSAESAALDAQDEPPES
jgi:hypothetical protein